MEALLAFLDHVHSMLTTTYHNTPIVLMAAPQWTRPDCETIVRYIFEKTKTPALCLIHSGIATQYGLRWPNMTVVDVGFEKVDVTCIYDSRIVSQREVATVPDAGREISGGEVFTMKLLELLDKKGFNYDMAEQLKRSNVCEVLPYSAEKPSLMELPEEAALAAPVPTAEPVTINEPSRPPAADVEEEVTNGEKGPDEDGVLDVANIVSSGNTREFLAKKEKEKAEKAKVGKRGREKESDAAKAVRLPNSKRVKNTFHYEELVTEDVVPEPKLAAAPVAPAAPAAALEAPEAPTTVPEQDKETKDVEMSDEPVTNGTAAEPSAPAEEAKPTNGEAAKQENGEGALPSDDVPKPEAPEATSEASAPAPEPTTVDPEPAAPAAQPEEAAAPPPASAEIQPGAEPEQRTRRVRRDIEIGLERFTFADRNEIDRITTAIYRGIQGIDDMYMRPSCWENLVFVGNGARLRGLRDNILQTLQARYLVSPSTATMFTSELPSNLGTPSGTGSQTPTGSFTGAPHQLPTTSSVNPLLQAATTAGLVVPGAPGAPGSNAGDGAPSHHFHSQTPTLIKLAPLPTYLSEWTKNGFEEAMFLGTQVAARLAFCVHNLDQSGAESQKYMSLNRVDYK